MSKPAGLLTFPGFDSSLAKYMQKAQSDMLTHWHNPFEWAMNSLFQMSDAANHAVESLLAHQKESLSLLLGPVAGASSRPIPLDNATLASKGRIETTSVAVVTGGIGGIGTEICKRFYDDGHQVIATYIAMESERAEQWQLEHLKAGYDLDIVECDVTDFDRCKVVARQLEKDYKHIDILVNCAGITRDATFKNMDPDKWQAVIETNLNSVFNVTRQFVDGMARRRYGRIINISSVNGQKGQFGQTNYATAKAGIIGFSKALALELADQGITVNSVCPGYVGTEMVEAIPEDIKNSIIAKIPVGRLAKPSEIADAVSFLAAENSGYITGSEISVNGALFTAIA
ncbi:MAG TPA: acetoacetyl-CoA reductase [Gammaproteobacteria bacterium]